MAWSISQWASTPAVHTLSNGSQSVSLFISSLAHLPAVTVRPCCAVILRLYRSPCIWLQPTGLSYGGSVWPLLCSSAQKTLHIYSPLPAAHQCISQCLHSGLLTKCTLKRLFWHYTCLLHSLFQLAPNCFRTSAPIHQHGAALNGTIQANGPSFSLPSIS